jgi:hypothetical protein
MSPIPATLKLLLLDAMEKLRCDTLSGVEYILLAFAIDAGCTVISTYRRLPHIYAYRDAIRKGYIRLSSNRICDVDGQRG